MQAAFTIAKVSPAPRAVRCAAVPVQTVDRRQSLGLFAAGVLTLAAPAARAIEIPSQNSTGSQSKPGSVPPNGSEASASGYNLQGTKKMGVSFKDKKKLLAKLKEEATLESKS